jgi:hypothetical protein
VCWLCGLCNVCVCMITYVVLSTRLFVHVVNVRWVMVRDHDKADSYNDDRSYTKSMCQPR